MATTPIPTTYTSRLQTFTDYWTAHPATARQLASIGHISDRPPLEAQEPGSRCISCAAFVKKDLSIKALEGTASPHQFEEGFGGFKFHHPGCVRLQVRIPLDPQAIFPGLHGGRIDHLRRKFERGGGGGDVPRGRGRGEVEGVEQRNGLFALPAEIRLEIYLRVLPALERVTEIVPLHGGSPRVITAMAYRKTGPRDTTKPNILRTCRAVNAEAMDLLYSNTTFKFASTKVMYLFLRNIGDAGRQLIRSVDVHCSSREDAIAFALLSSCEKLRSICLRLPRPMLLFPRAPIWIIDGVACMLTLDGIEEVTFGICESSPNYMSDEKPDAAIIRKELTRPKGSPANTRFLEKYVNI